MSDEQVAMFLSMCPGTTSIQAKRYLEEAKGDMDAAVTKFIDAMEAGEGNPSSNSAPPPAPATTAPRAAPANAPANASANAAKRGPQQYYVGGGESSGQAVISPSQPSREPADADGGQSTVDRLFQQAREAGARDGDTREMGFGNAHVAFSGTGRRLGHTEGTSPVVPAVVRSQRRIQIAFYKNGFVVDDGPLQSATDAHGQAFLETLQRGFVPPEVARQYPNTDIDVALVNHGDEDYAPPSYTAFSGSGRRLGATGGAPSTQGSTAFSGVQAAQAAAPLPTSFSFNPDEQPVGKVMIQTPDGRRYEHKVNPNRHTVNDLRFLASQAIPGAAPHTIELVVRDMPPRKLDDFSQTIAAAKCNNALILAKTAS